MVVHLERGIAAAACEAYYVVLAIVYSDGGLVDSDVIRAHVEDDPYLSLILWVDHSIKIELEDLKQRVRILGAAKSQMYPWNKSW